jgi:hypothetical protein
VEKARRRWHGRDECGPRKKGNYPMRRIMNQNRNLEHDSKTGAPPAPFNPNTHLTDKNLTLRA